MAFLLVGALGTGVVGVPAQAMTMAIVHAGLTDDDYRGPVGGGCYGGCCCGCGCGGGIGSSGSGVGSMKTTLLGSELVQAGLVFSVKVDTKRSNIFPECWKVPPLVTGICEDTSGF